MISDSVWFTRIKLTGVLVLTLGFMKRDGRKRRFNEAIVDMLYPSSPPREPSPPQVEQELEPVEALIQGSGSDVISGSLDEYENASTSGDEEHDSGTEKLTRAQRKKIRKKKLKEEAIRRGKLIGPLLAPTHQVAEDAPAVRSNASEEGSGADEIGDEAARATSKKTKNRRMAKRLAKEKRIASTSDNCNDRTSTSTSSVDPKEAPM